MSPGLLRLILAAILILACVPAMAQQRQLCAPRQALLDKLGAEYGEIPTAGGVTSSGQLMEVLTSPSGTWSIIVGAPGGPVCLVSSGHGWQAAPAIVPGRGA